MKIAIFGASGRVGKLTVEEALKRSHEVKILVHKSNPFEDDGSVQVVKGDIHDPKAVSEVVTGSDVIIIALGSWGTSSKDIVSSGTRNVISAMKTNNIKRLVTLTGNAVICSNDSPTFTHKFVRSGLGIAAPKILSDGEEHIKLLENSNLDWTSVRSPAMNSKGSGEYTLSMEFGKPIESVSRASVANSLVDLIESKDFTQQAPFIHRS